MRLKVSWALSYQCEPLEPRRLLAVVTVTTANDVADAAGTSTIDQLNSNGGPDGLISLREAINAVNHTSGANEIHFAIGTGLQTIHLSSALPTILMNGTSIRGETQPGFAAGGNKPLIDLDGSGASGTVDGLHFTSSFNTVRGLIINHFSQDGIHTDSSTSNLFVGNYIGTTSSGTGLASNTKHGIEITGGSNTTIGGSNVVDRNVISGNNASGIYALQSNQLAILNNNIGVGADGVTGVGNIAEGIFLLQTGNSVVGGLTSDRRNMIAGNGGNGIVIAGSQAMNNTVIGNYIGATGAGTTAISNGKAGILITQGFLNASSVGIASNNAIGGTAPGAGNVIAANVLSGIELANGTNHNTVEGNLIGTTADGSAALENFQYGVDIYGGSTNNSIGGNDEDDGNVDGVVAARNIISGNLKGGIKIEGSSSSNAVEGNYIGTKSDGSAAIPNQGDGIHVNASANNVIGGSTDGAGNLISGNVGAGVNLSNAATNTTIYSNRIGTDPTALHQIANLAGGVLIENSASNFVGGPTAFLGTGLGNIIGGNGLEGVEITGAGSSGNGVYGNLIGTTVVGTGALDNAGDGVGIDDGASGNFIGAADVTGGPQTLQRRNLISGNDQNGVRIAGDATTNNSVLNNRIGTSIAGLTAIPNASAGVAIVNANANTIGLGNLISGNSDKGIYISGESVTGNIIQGCLIGVDQTGNVALPNNGTGIYISAASNTQIGGTTTTPGASPGNVISGNGFGGIIISGDVATGNTVQGNLIGLNRTGNAALPNTYWGISIEDGRQNIIGGSSPATGSSVRNVISGNESDGIAVNGYDAFANQIQGNFIGTDITGMTAIANQSNGVEINDAPGTILGGSTPLLGVNTGNVISGNALSGLSIHGDNASANLIKGNLIGMAFDGQSHCGNQDYGIIIENATGNIVGGNSAPDGNVVAFNGTSLGHRGYGVQITSGTGNRIRRTDIFSNNGLGIHLGDPFAASASAVANDVGDADQGADQLQNFPFVMSNIAQGSENEMTFGLYSEPNSTFTVDLFKNTTPDPSGFGQGEHFIFSGLLSTDDSGFGTLVVFTQAADKYISAVATDPDGNSSEFSMVDTDADGLADVWETTGIDADMDGETDLTLTNANPAHRDVYVEYDSMQGMRPSISSLVDVVQAYAAAPLANPDGATGITLHIIDGGDQALPRAPWNDLSDAGFPHAFDLLKNGSLFGDHTDGHLGTPENRQSGDWAEIRAAILMSYRYCIFAYSIGSKGTDGIARSSPSNEFAVALGKSNVRGGTPQQQSGVFMHELGHTLGLHHGGGDDIQYKPNYFSVMNYEWTVPFAGIKDNWTLDYSRRASLDVNENDINELLGFGGTPGKFMLVGPAFDTTTNEPRDLEVVPQTGTWDYDGSGGLSVHGSADLNFFGDDTNNDGIINSSDGSPGQTFKGYDDWDNLHYPLLSGDFMPTDSDLTFAQFLNLNSAGNGPGKIQFSNDYFAANESDGLAKITVVRAGGTTGPVAVHYKTIAGGSATAGADYTSVTGTINFAAHEYLKTFTIPIVDDTTLEGTETVNLQLLGPTGAPLGDLSTATLEIAEPMTVKFQPTIMNVSQSAGTADVQLVLTGDTGQTLDSDITLSVSDLLSGSAAANTDYVLPPDMSVTFPAGSATGTTMTIPITIVDHLDHNTDKTINLGLSTIDSFSAVSSADDLMIHIRDSKSAMRLLKDVKPGSGSGIADLGFFDKTTAVVGSTLFFIADSGTGPALFKSDGTTDGTVLVKQLPAAQNSTPYYYLTACNGAVFFAAADGGDLPGLWKSDGTTAGTVVVKAECDPSQLTAVGSTLFFEAYDASHGYELWKSDGSPAGTMLVKDIYPLSGASSLNALVGIGGKLYFSDSDFSHGVEPWVSDGTPGGTFMLKDIWQGNSSNPYDFTELNGQVYFFATNQLVPQLWKTDGTTGGTTKVLNVPSGNGNAPQSLTNVNDTLYFQTPGQDQALDLWKSDGTFFGTTRVAEVDFDNSGFSPGVFVNFNGTLLFDVATDFYDGDVGNYSSELWTSDGTPEGTLPLKAIKIPLYRAQAVVDGKLYFGGKDATHGFELWSTDATSNGTVMVADLGPGSAGSSPDNLTTLGDSLIVSATDAAHGRELYTVGQNDAPTITTPATSNADPVVTSTANLSVVASDDAAESHLTYTWSLIGTPPGNVTFSANGNNAAKNTTATFVDGGIYHFLVTVTDADGFSTTSDVTVNVTFGLSGIAASSGSQYNVSQSGSTYDVDIVAGTVVLNSDLGAGRSVSMTVADNASVVFTSSQTLQDLIVPASATVTVSPGSNSVVTVNTLTMSGSLDISDNSLIIDYLNGSPIGSIQSSVKSGFAKGTWSGPGIFSSTSALANSVPGGGVMSVGFADNAILHQQVFRGQHVDFSSVLVRYTYASDSNLDGKVSSDDFDVLAANFGGNGKGWVQGDDNFDGVVNALDFNALATNYGRDVIA